METYEKKHIGVVLGLNESGLAVARSLGREGVKVFGFYHSKDIGCYSRYIKAKLCPHPLVNEHEFIKFLITFGKKKVLKPVLLIAGDDFLLTISRFESELSKYFLLNIPKNNLIESISDKFAQYQLAKSADIEVPATYYFKNILDFEKVQDNINFPVILKAREVNKWRSVLGAKKAIFINSYFELVRELDKLIKKGLYPICQELIRGPDSNHFKYCAYFYKGKEYATFTLQKIRQYPIKFGMGCSVISVDNLELMDIGKKFFTNIQYNGIGSAEFKWDNKNKKFKLIELNPRYWLQNSLPTKCGINFPYIDYLLQTGINVEPTKDFKTKVKWINIYFDLGSFMDYRKKGELTLFSWIKSLIGRKVWSDFSWDDPIPGFHHIGFGLRLLELPGYFVRKLTK